jgi:hypothetical protein
VSYYHWLGKDAQAHVPFRETQREICPEMFIAYADTSNQMAASDEVEADGWITLWPEL